MLLGSDTVYFHAFSILYAILEIYLNDWIQCHMAFMDYFFYWHTRVCFNYVGENCLVFILEGLSFYLTYRVNQKSCPDYKYALQNKRLIQ